MLTMAVISIVITAPLGAILILALGPLLLETDGIPVDPHAHSSDPDSDDEVEAKGSVRMTIKEKEELHHTRH